MSIQSLWDRMNYATRQIALYISNDAEACTMAKDIARCVLSDNGSRRLECEDHYDRKVDPVILIGDIFKAFCTSSKYWGPQINRLFRKDVDYSRLAEWWIAVATTRPSREKLTDPKPVTPEDKLIKKMGYGATVQVCDNRAFTDPD